MSKDTFSLGWTYDMMHYQGPELNEIIPTDPETCKKGALEEIEHEIRVITTRKVQPYGRECPSLQEILEGLKILWESFRDVANDYGHKNIAEHFSIKLTVLE